MPKKSPQDNYTTAPVALFAEKLDAGLLRADGKFLYPVRHNIPVMLVDEAIPLARTEKLTEDNHHPRRNNMGVLPFPVCQSELLPERFE